eukprot:Nk52_evm8s277 gene=Nk52_evmTU8s277
MVAKSGTKAAGGKGKGASSTSKAKGGNTKKLELKSPAEFFSNNKTIAGFDNPGKSLYTTIREFVENALDAAEAIDVLPDISIRLEEITRSQLNKMLGLGETVRVDEKMYAVRPQDKKKEKGGKKKQQIEEDGMAENDQEEGVGESGTGKKKEGGNSSSSAVYYRVTVRDNGSGMPHADIPNMFGRVLAGTKYGVQQARGRFGLGAKMALIWSKMSTGRPIDIKSAQQGSDFKTHCVLDIDIYKNTPNVRVHEQLPNEEGWRGSEISVIIEGNWSGYRARILQYMRQMAIITPYAGFEFRFTSSEGEGSSGSFAVRYARRSDYMPPRAREVLHHPSSVNLIVMKRLASLVPPSCTLKRYLTSKYAGIDSKMATRIITELGAEFADNMKASELTDRHHLKILHLFAQLKFPPPDGDCLSPSGEYNLRLGIMKELRPDMVATYQDVTHVVEGHPFIVDAAVSLGGKSVHAGLNVYRFANRIPLLFEGGGDVVTRTVLKRINWTAYRIRVNQDKVGVFVSIVSTKIPFKGTGKEYIGDDCTEIANSVKRAIQQCCLQLKAKLVRAGNLKQLQERKSNLQKYVPNVAKSVASVLEKIKAGKENDPQVYERVAALPATEITPNALSRHLTLYVDRTDAEQAFEHVAATGIKTGAKRDQIFLLPKGGGPLKRIKIEKTSRGKDNDEGAFLLSLMPPALIEP